MDIERAHQLGARGNLAAIRRALRSAGTRRSTSRLILQAVVAQYSGDMEACVASFASALRLAKESECAYIIDLYAPVLYMQGRGEEAREMIAAVKHIPAHLRALFESFEMILASSRGEDIDLSRRISVSESSKLNAARTLQRISIAAYCFNDFETALDAAKTSARASEREGG